jgi:hypothetical protein
MRLFRPLRIAYLLLTILSSTVLLLRSDTYRPSLPYLAASRPDLGEPANPGIVIIDCDFATGHDRVVVYDRNPDPRAEGGSGAITNFVNAVWIFDAGADGSAQLIIRFVTDSGQVVAYLFDDQDGDGEVAYQARGWEIIVTESRNWHVKAAAPRTWITPGGSVNPDISFFIDGSILRYLSWGEALPGLSWASQYATTDGDLDWVIDVVDQDRDGIADYQLQRLLSAFPADLPVFRSTLYANERRTPPLPYLHSVFWPLLVGSHAYESYNYFDHPPVVTVDWDKAKIDRVGILGYPTEQGYHINSRAAAWAKSQVNYADFENPMAYYDLAGDQDGRPELFVRFEVFASHDRFFLDGTYPAPMTQVEYAWDQDNDGRWDYHLSLGGANPITSTVDFPDFSIRTVPYAQIPAWVTGRPWAAAVFLAAQAGGYWNSEGMSLWNVNRGYRDGGIIEPSRLRDAYLVGSSDRPPIDDYSEIPPGFRGEVAFESFREPTLYISAIDQNLHLKYATSGIWVIDANREVRYSNLTGGAYLDHWEYYCNGTLQQQLAFLETALASPSTPCHSDLLGRQLDCRPTDPRRRNVLLYAGNNEIRLKLVSVAPVEEPILSSAGGNLQPSTLPVEENPQSFNFQSSTFPVEGPALSLVDGNLQPSPVLSEVEGNLQSSTPPALALSTVEGFQPSNLPTLEPSNASNLQPKRSGATSTVEGPILFEMPPPRDHAEWLRLRELLGENAASPDQIDFLEIFSRVQGDYLLRDQVPGEEIRVRRAKMRDLRWTGSAFRFVLELGPGYSVIGADFLGLQGRPAGSYLVAFDGEFVIQPLMPVSLKLLPASGNEIAAPLQEYVPGEILLGIKNRGSADAHQVIATARIFRSAEGQDALLLDPQTVEISGGEVVVVKFPWTPRESGTYAIQLEAARLDENGALLETQAQERTLTVLPAEEAGKLQLLGIFGLVSPHKVILLLVMLAAAGGFTARSIVHAGLSEVSSLNQTRASGKGSRDD